MCIHASNKKTASNKKRRRVTGYPITLCSGLPRLPWKSLDTVLGIPLYLIHVQSYVNIPNPLYSIETEEMTNFQIQS